MALRTVPVPLGSRPISRILWFGLLSSRIVDRAHTQVTEPIPPSRGGMWKVPGLLLTNRRTMSNIGQLCSATDCTKNHSSDLWQASLMLWRLRVVSVLCAVCVLRAPLIACLGWLALTPGARATMLAPHVLVAMRSVRPDGARRDDSLTRKANCQARARACCAKALQGVTPLCVYAESPRPASHGEACSERRLSAAPAARQRRPNGAPAAPKKNARAAPGRPPSGGGARAERAARASDGLPRPGRHRGGRQGALHRWMSAVSLRGAATSVPQLPSAALCTMFFEKTYTTLHCASQLPAPPLDPCRRARDAHERASCRMPPRPARSGRAPTCRPAPTYPHVPTSLPEASVQGPCVDNSTHTSLCRKMAELLNPKRTATRHTSIFPNLPLPGQGACAGTGDSRGRPRSPPGTSPPSPAGAR